MNIEIDYLANHHEAVPLVAKWCCNEWPWYYDDGNFQSALAYHQQSAVFSGIPCALVALDKGVVIGTIALLEEDMDLRQELSPWLGCLYIAPDYRGQGLARTLIAEGVALAARQEVRELFAWTRYLGTHLRNSGWTFHESIRYRGDDVEILKISLIS